jgi:hypothetical protein
VFSKAYFFKKTVDLFFNMSYSKNIRNGEIQMSRYSSFVKLYDMEGKIRWTNNLESAKLILKKQEYVKKIMALRSLEKNLSGFSGAEAALDNILKEYVKYNKKIIAANRKMEREGWSSISDETFQRNYGAQ